MAPDPVEPGEAHRNQDADDGHGQGHLSRQSGRLKYNDKSGDGHY